VAAEVAVPSAPTFGDGATVRKLKRKRPVTSGWFAIEHLRPMIGVALACCLGLAYARPDFPNTRNDPSYRESAPPAVFPNTTIPPKYPEPKPQTHGLDLSKRDWDTAKAYFKWLCENEAGEFVYKTVENVDSVFEMRRRPEFERDWRMFDRYYLEDPWGWPISANGRERIVAPYFYVMPNELGGVSYKDSGQWRQKGDYFRYFPEQQIPVLERVTTPLDRQRYGDAPFVRFMRVWPTHPEYDRDDKGNVRMFQLRKYLNAPDRKWPLTGSFESIAISESPNRQLFDDKMRSVGEIIPNVGAVHEIKSRYGFMWRGIERTPNDRELGIGGGEVLVFDLQTNEVLAVRRNFRLSGTFKGTRNVDWLLGQQCLDFGYLSLHKKVLKPIDPYQHLNIK
jgi:hypothetical protein